MTNQDILNLIPCYLPDDECWEYQGTYNRDGYGQTRDTNHRTVRAHRVMYQEYYGPIPPGMYVRHTCDNPSCCNPHHLLVGTQADNMRDAIARGRFKSNAGECNPRANLSQQLVDDIRKIYASGMWSYGLLAQLFDIPRSTVAHIIKRYTWAS